MHDAHKTRAQTDAPRTGVRSNLLRQACGLRARALCFALVGAGLISACTPTQNAAHGPPLVPSEIESPETLSISGLGLWNGLISSAGVWAVSDKVAQKQRVVIKNPVNSRQARGTLFPFSPLDETDVQIGDILISSDAARALGVIEPDEFVFLEVISLVPYAPPSEPEEPAPPESSPVDTAVVPGESISLVIQSIPPDLSVSASSAPIPDAAPPQTPQAQSDADESPQNLAQSAAQGIFVATFTRVEGASSAAAALDAAGLTARIFEGDDFWAVFTLGTQDTLEYVKTFGYADATFMEP